MDIFVARQPIYDRNLRVFAYELLYRDSAEMGLYTAKNSDSATLSVILDAFLSIGIETLTNRNPGFINFTENILMSGVVKMLPAKYLGIEILETVEPSDAILDVCGELKRIGYTIVLDDYSYNDSTGKFIRYADIIKMDFLQSDDAQLRAIIRKYKKAGIRFVAEKIETKADYDRARAYGYDYFQGYYFTRPSLVRSKDLLPLQISALKVLEILRDEGCDMEEIAGIIGQDPGMAYKLFRLANSVMYGGREKITNVVSAIVRIGLTDLRVWVLYIMLHGINKDKPDELIKQSMFRAWAAEEICRKKRLGGDVSAFSLVGLFSMMDVIMDTSFEKILAQINLSETIAGALLHPGDDLYGAVIRVIRAYDDADWDEAQRAGDLIGLSLGEYREIYLRAIERCDSVYNGLI